MEVKENPFSASVERLNGLMSWWGITVPTGNGPFDRQMKRLQQFATDCRKVCADAYCGEMDALFSSNERLGHSIQGLLRYRRPPELLSPESEILAILLDDASCQARRWVELTQKLQERCSAMTLDAASDLRQRTEEPVPMKGEGEPTQQPAKTALRRAAQT
ncbi:MAG: hypothetical protein M0T84_05100 [Betaproteobacteria bacterium]|nr:hypothetical protein [Betaproteobacteria bacterium]